MPGPNTPATASGPVPPPVIRLPFVQPDGCLTASGLDFLQVLWAAIFGGGGIIDLQFITNISPGVTLAQAEALFQADQASPLSTLLGRMGALEQKIDALEKFNIGVPLVREVSSSPVLWTPAIAGAGTAGTQTYSTQWGMLINIGPATLALFSLVMTALDGATAGDVIITGLPQAASAGANVQSGWLSTWGDLTFGGGFTTPSVQIAPGVTNISLVQNQPAGAAATFDAAGLAATTALAGGLLYFR